MPYRQKKPCAKSGCPELVEGGTAYCENHRRDTRAYSHSRYDRTRNKKHTKFYNSSRWRKLRDRYIKRNPLCEHCKGRGSLVPAKEVDHKIPIKINFEKRFDYNNLQALCKSCHATKTYEDKERYDEL